MADSKEIKIAAGFDGSKILKWTQQISKAFKGVFNTKQAKDFNKEITNLDKGLERVQKKFVNIHKIVDQTTRKNIQAAKETQKAWAQLERLDRAFGSDRQARVRDRYQRMYRGPYSSDRYDEGHDLIARQNAKLQDRADRISRGLPPDEEPESKTQQRYVKAMLMAQIGKTVLSAGGNVAGQVLNLDLKRFQSEATTASLVGKLYNEAASGDFSSFFAMALKNQKGRVAGIANRADTAEKVSKYTGIGGDLINFGLGVGQVGLGGGMSSTGIGGAAGGWYLGSQGVGNIGNAVVSGTGNITDLIVHSPQAQAAIKSAAGIEAAKMSQPVALRVMQEMQSQAANLTRQYRIAGGSDGYMSMASAVTPYMTHQEGAALREAMAEQMGFGGAQRYVGAAAGAERRLGIDRMSAASGLAGLSYGRGGPADEQLERIMRRATAAGVDDSKLRGALVTLVAESQIGPGGRAGSSAVADVLLGMMGSGSTLQDLREIRSGAGQADAFFGGKRQGVFDVLGFNAAGRAVRAAGMGGGDALMAASVLSRTSMTDLINGTEQLTNLGMGSRSLRQGYAGDMLGQLIRMTAQPGTAAFNEFKGAGFNAQAFLGSASPKAREQIVAMMQQAGMVSGSREGSAFLDFIGRGVGGIGTGPLNGNGPLRSGYASGGAEALNMANASMQLDILARMGNSQIQSAVAAAVDSMINWTKTLESIDSNQLSDPGLVFEKVTTGVNNLTDAMDKMLTMMEGHGVTVGAVSSVGGSGSW